MKGSLAFPIEADCPVPLDLLGQLYRAEPTCVTGMLRDVSEDRRARLAMFCYHRAHLRELGLTVAASCDAGRLAQLAGTMGQVMAEQCRAGVREFGGQAPHWAPKKISLASARS
jgi:hypothetical protein